MESPFNENTFDTGAMPEIIGASYQNDIEPNNIEFGNTAYDLPENQDFLDNESGINENLLGRRDLPNIVMSEERSKSKHYKSILAGILLASSVDATIHYSQISKEIYQVQNKIGAVATLFAITEAINLCGTGLMALSASNNIAKNLRQLDVIGRFESKKAELEDKKLNKKNRATKALGKIATASLTGIGVAAEIINIVNPLKMLNGLKSKKAELEDKNLYRAGWTIKALGAIGTASLISFGAIAELPKSTWPLAFSASCASIVFSTLIPLMPRHLIYRGKKV